MVERPAASDPYRYFRLEARELLDQFAQALLDLERAGGGADVQRLLRLAHTLKGAARVVKQQAIADDAHAIEDVLAPFRDGGEALPPDRIDQVLHRLDTIGRRLPALAPAAEPGTEEGAAGPGAAADDARRTVRADLADMDSLIDGVAETHAALGGLRAAARGLEQTRHLAELLLAQLAQPVSRGAAEPAHAMAEELTRRLGGLERALTATLDRVDRELGQLRDGAEQLRLVPAGPLLVALDRTARDDAQASGKKVSFTGRGGDIRLDAEVMGVVQGALVQIVRNAVAHGIEDPAGRLAAGKAEAGRIEVEVARRGRQAVFTCRDDGRGLDLDAVRRAAARRGLIADAGHLEHDAGALVELLMRGGISTADGVTGLAGRGVGLDVVRAAAARLGGTVAVRSEAGRGAWFELTVPMSMASLDALMVEAAGRRAAVPLEAVRSAVRLASGDVAQGAAGATVLHDGRAMPFLPLAAALHGVPAADAARNWSAIVVAGADGEAVVGVDRLLGSARVVVRPLPAPASAGRLVAGAALDAQGDPLLVLDPAGLVAEVRAAGAAPREPPPDRRPVLVVDDSLTTRMLEQSILEAAGYDVDLATSGEEALEIARARPYALFLVDVEMPGIDGFTFIERIRADPALGHIPAILVTSRGAPEDRKRGRAVGADGYIVKGAFDQTALLAMIAPLVGRVR